MNNIELALMANTIRKDIISMLNKAGSGHSAGALGLADIFSVLYFDKLKHNPKKPNWEDRDYLFLSNGHICPALYSALARTGYFKTEELFTLRQFHSRLQGHPHNLSLPGIENSSGPLGQGISQAVGLAAALKRNNLKNHVYTIIGDGEINEGQVWEALLFASKEKLDNLTIIIDRNNIQIDGFSNDVMPLNNLAKKLLSFNLAVIELDGNNIPQIKHAINHAKKIKNKPTCLLAKTIPGKGISFIENKFEWHGKAPNNEESKKALAELNKIEQELNKKC